MAKLFIFLLFVIPILLTGCNNANIIGYSEFPRGEAYPETYQKKMQAAHHWDELAKVEAKNMLCQLPKYSKPIYIRKNSDVNGEVYNSYNTPPSPFQKAFRNLITSHLVRQDAFDVELVESRNSIKIDYDVQILTHEDRGYLRPKTGSFALIAANLAMIYDAQHWGAPGLVGIPIVAQLEWLNLKKGAGHSPVEVIITTRAVDNNKIIMSDSRIYYINDGDKGHYEQDSQKQGSHHFKVVSQLEN